MAKNKRDWESISAKKGKRYVNREDRSGGEKDRNSGHGARRKERPDAFFGDVSEGEPGSNVIIGRNPVMEALKNHRDMEKVLIARGADGSALKIGAMAKDAGVPVYASERTALDRIAGGKAHQGVIAYASAYKYSEMEDIYAKAAEQGEEPFVVILDNLEDPHNLGAVLRTCECAGAHGVIIPKRRACGLTEVVAKASAGAIEYVPCVRVANIGQVIDALKEDGFWIAACDMGGTAYYRQDLTGKLAVVIGSEGSGISPLVKKKCDFTVSMPMRGRITSLNASNAAAVLMYEVRRQRDEASL